MLKVFHNDIFAMGTRMSVVIPGIDEGRGEHIFSLISKEVNRLEEKLSYFKERSEISTINKYGARHPVPVTREMFDILHICQQYAERTNGAFDITLRPLYRYWQEYENGREETITDILKKVGVRKIQLNNETSSVKLENEEVEIDLGGFGKGYALEKIMDMLRRFSVPNAFISFGESTVLTLGSQPGGHCWKVGINDYLNPGQALYTFSMNDGAVSTSSNFTVRDDGTLHKRINIINPITGYPADEFSVTSVSASSPLEAEILSTAFVTMSEDQIREVRNNFVGIEIIKIRYGENPPMVVYI
jgi:FAD:protein FMN transferase